MITIILKNGFFWSAYKFYNWKKYVPGVGIKLSKLIDDIIQIKSKYGIFEINGLEAKQLVEKYNSIKKVGYTQTEIGVIPLTAFKKINIEKDEDDF